MDGIERVALSFGLSIAITPLLGLALNYTPFGIRLTPILIVMSVFTIAVAIGAYARRSRISEMDRFGVDVNEFKDFLLAQTFLLKMSEIKDIQMKVDAITHNLLRSISQRKNRPLEDIVKDAIREYIRKYEKEIEKDPIFELIGSFETKEGDWSERDDWR